MENDFPVYLFTGFLEGGKTKFIQETLEDKRFNNGERTLLITCEEGIEEYDPSRFYGKNIYICNIESEEDLTEANLAALQEKYKAERAIIEYNGMWMEQTLFNAMPESWLIYQEMCFVDATTFTMYNQNMRQLMQDKFTNAEMVAFNRVTPDMDKMFMHKVVRAASRRADITYEYTDGHFEFDDIQDPLPFDINAPVIEIKDEDYALWYRDMVEEMPKYNGKVVKFKGLVSRDKKMPDDALAIGRHIMTCCEADIQYSAVVAVSPEAKNLANGCWKTITAKLNITKHRLYRKPGPVLTVISMEDATAPEQPVATFF